MTIEKETQYDICTPKFCSQCGGRMILGKKRINRYDKKTSKIESYQYTAKCEKIYGWKAILNWLVGVHDDFLVIDTPYSYITKGPSRTILKKVY